jgi:hypothetical protein
LLKLCESYAMSFVSSNDSSNILKMLPSCCKCEIISCCSYVALHYIIETNRLRSTSSFFLWFWGNRIIRHMIIFKKERPGGECLSYAHWPWRQHFDDESWCGSGYAFLAESSFCVSLFCDSIMHWIREHEYMNIHPPPPPPNYRARNGPGHVEWSAQ